MFIFDRFEFSEQRVVLCIGKRRLAEHVVLVVGAVEGSAQFGGAGCGVGGGQGELGGMISCVFKILAMADHEVRGVNARSYR